ncbi:D-TA family PLP-dependent enzyme [Qingshengfaniella alkalisoli]|uniref:D-TA family PLP-dependent enzyme n=1 Tax=Qingshengfaniella alkalisoli TaxID=2599296 RepID=A0A5B8IYV8_9RHOB|nr:D-TA family PLP-dependent enzyme [Qingshengfaniella alkalisoli]QDY70904.1 D-TA family PLP-dependent enzyme [Qingshengfaniella alkalisoli]
MKIGQKIDTLLTPIPVVDEDVMATNIARVQAYFDEMDRDFRPHIKTHKLPSVAKLQIAAGARGINCQKVSEAEVFAEEGFDDILITFNIMGSERLERLRALNDTIKLRVVADNEVVVDGLSAAFTGHEPLDVLVECDTGAKRNGVQTPDEAVALAMHIHESGGLNFMGLMTYPPKSGGEPVAERFFTETMAKLAEKGIDCPIRTFGGSPSLFNAHLVPSATEHRAGTYVYNDRSMVREGHCTFDDCAMNILTTVVSRPTADRAVIDAGSKTLTQDLIGFTDFGYIRGYPDARIVSLSEEHGVIDLSACEDKPEIGELLRVIPNHTCVVTNLFDRMVFHRDGMVTRIEDVAARGTVW